jgi:LacI family transcriptional regulator
MFKYNEVIQRLKSEITETPADSKLPSRKELCGRFQCTRTTIDRAIKELAAQGYLYSRQGSGTYITPIETHHPQITRAWALVIPDIRFSLYSMMLRGIGDAANKNGIGVQIFNTDEDPSKQRSIVKNLVRANFDGLIIVPVTTDEPQHEIFLWLKEQGVPFVFCNRGIEGVTGVPLVCSNGFYGGYLAARHLFEKGYKRPAFISHRFYHLPRERMEGYMAAVQERGTAVNRDYLVPRCAVSETGDPRRPFAWEEAKRLLELPEPPDSFFCSSEATLEGVYKAVHDTGLTIPGDIGVISHDNSPMCLQQFPQVTAVTLDCYQIGRNAAVILEKMMRQEEMPDLNLYVLQPEMVERRSCLGPETKGQRLDEP